MEGRRYVLITPAYNEEKLIEAVIQSVMAQNIRPLEWIVVSDQSTDGTDAIVRGYEGKANFLRLIRLEGKKPAGFASMIRATHSGRDALKTKNYDYIGILDADIQLEPSYYEDLMKKFEADPKLGIAGGELIERVDGVDKACKVHPMSVPGGIQFFRRECFWEQGGFLPIPEGGMDSVAEVTARMKGWRTRTFDDLKVYHLKPMNISQGGALRRRWQMGVRDYILGNHPLFEIIKCCFRWFEYPPLISSFARLAGFFSCYLRRKKRPVDPAVIAFLRREQLGRLFPMLKKRGQGRLD